MSVNTKIEMSLTLEDHTNWCMYTQQKIIALDRTGNLPRVVIRGNYVRIKFNQEFRIVKLHSASLDTKVYAPWNVILK